MCQRKNILKCTDDKPLKCYKVVTKSPLHSRNKNGGYSLSAIYHSYYHMYRWENGLNKARKSIFSKPLEQLRKLDIIEDGFFHAYLNKRTAAAHAAQNGLYTTVIELEIPPHTTYYEGLYGTKTKTVACQKMKFIKEIGIQTNNK